MRTIFLRLNRIERDKEHFWVIGLNIKKKTLFVDLVSIGSVNRAIVMPTNVFRVAILKNAVELILVHNHPSGDLTPSQADKNITNQLIQVGKIVDVQVIDHLIITPTSYLSFEDTGLFSYQ